MDLDQQKQSQKICGQCYGPKDWGITRWQCLKLLKHLQREIQVGKWDRQTNVYTFVKEYIIPKTMGHGIGYSLLVNRKEPKEVTVMVSHAWGEPAVDFLESIVRSTTDDDVLFVCSLSLYQCEDQMGPTLTEQLGKRPEDSPFQLALAHIKSQGETALLAKFVYQNHSRLILLNKLLFTMTVISFYCPPMFDGCVCTYDYCATRGIVYVESLDDYVYGWTWRETWPGFRLVWPATIFLFLTFAFLNFALYHVPHFKGRMLVVPNTNTDIYSRLWCVYEIFIAAQLGVPVVLAQSLAHAGSCTSAVAQTSCVVDSERIAKEIQDSNGGDLDRGYEDIDRHIELCMVKSAWNVFWTVALWGSPVVVAGIAWYNLESTTSCQIYFVGDTLGIIFGISSVVFLYYKLFKINQGEVHARYVVFLATLEVALGTLFQIILAMVEPFSRGCDLANDVEHGMTTRVATFLTGFSKLARLGFFWGAILSIGFLMGSWLGPHATLPEFQKYAPLPKFQKSPREYALMGFLCLCYVLFRGFVNVGEKEMPGQLWLEPLHLWPEVFRLVTEFMALFAFPSFGIWTAVLWFGLRIKWEGKFCKEFKVTCEDTESCLSGSE